MTFVSFQNLLTADGTSVTSAKNASDTIKTSYLVNTTLKIQIALDYDKLFASSTEHQAGHVRESQICVDLYNEKSNKSLLDLAKEIT